MQNYPGEKRQLFIKMISVFSPFIISKWQLFLFLLVDLLHHFKWVEIVDKKENSIIFSKLVTTFESIQIIRIFVPDWLGLSQFSQGVVYFIVLIKGNIQNVRFSKIPMGCFLVMCQIPIAIDLNSVVSSMYFQWECPITFISWKIWVDINFRYEHYFTK